MADCHEMAYSPKIRIGPAGFDRMGPLKGIEKAARLGFECIEVEFTYGVRMAPDVARALGDLARRKRIVLSVHAPYYINLASEEKDKLAASHRRVLDSCLRAHLMGAKNVVFHAGFYQKRSPRETFDRIRSAVADLMQVIEKNKWQVKLCPEITGKSSQFGSLEELKHLKRSTGCSLCVDFAHLFARHQGAVDWSELLGRLPKRLHAHFSGISYGPKGEKKHCDTSPEFFRPLAAAMLKRGVHATLICESPRPYEDALMMQRVVNQLRHP
jgi:deoxyribonuclease-4